MKQNRASAGAEWDPESRKWFVKTGMDLQPFASWMPGRSRTYLNVPFSEKEELKQQCEGRCSIGAKFDGEIKKWYVRTRTYAKDPSRFAKWPVVHVAGNTQVRLHYTLSA
jgi:hypothetical protein